MDHMRILGIEPSSVIQRKKVGVKDGEKCQNVPKEAKAKRDGVINPQNYKFYQFLHRKFWWSQNATNQLRSTVELGLCPRGLLGPPAVTLTK